MVEAQQTERPYVPSTRTEDRKPQETPQHMEVGNRLQLMIVRIGDEKRELKEEHLLKLHQFAVQNEKDHSELIASHLSKSICLLTHKTQFYAALVASIANDSETLSKKICQKVVEFLQNLINENLTRDQAISCFAAMKFIGTIVELNLLSTLFMSDTIKSLLDEAEKTMKKSFDFYLYLALNGLMFSAKALQKSGDYDVIISKFEELLNKRTKGWHQFNKISSNFSKEEQFEDLLDIKFRLFKQKQVAPLEGLFVNEEFAEKLRSKLNSPIKNLTPLVFSSSSTPKYQSPRLNFLGQDCDINTLIVFEQSSEILLQMGDSYQLASKALSNLCLPTKKDSHDLIVSSAVLSELVMLPQPSQHPAFYARVAEQLSQNLSKFQNIMQNQIEVLVKDNVGMDRVVKENLINFYSFFFVCKGSCDFGNFVNVTFNDGHMVEFVKEVLSSMVRKSYLKKVKEQVPEQLHDYLPPERLDPIYNYFKEDGDDPDAAIVLDKINSKTDIETLQAFLSDPANFNSPIDTVKQIFLEALLKRTQRSVEHVKRLADHYSIVLQSFYHQQPESQIQALSLICAFWKNNKVRAVQIIDRLTELKLFDFQNIIKFVFRQLGCINNVQQDFEIEFGILSNITEKICKQDEILSQQLKFQKAAVTHSIGPELIEELSQSLERVPFERERHLLAIFDGYCTALKEIENSISESKEKALQLVKRDFLIFLRNSITYWTVFKQKAIDICNKQVTAKEVMGLFSENV